MRAVLQLVSSACVSVDGKTVASIEKGFVVLLGVSKGDDEHKAALLAQKLAKLRIFPDEDGHLNRSLTDEHVRGDVLLIPNFTLLANCKKSRRPDFFAAAGGEEAERLFLTFREELRLNFSESEFMPNIVAGIFGAHMQVTLTNDGPVTLVLDTDEYQ